MNRQKHPQHDDLVSLAAGETNPLAAARLRRHIARCPECQREWTEIAALWADLGGLSTVTPSRSAPVWPVIDTLASLTATPTITIGGLTMKKRTAALACALTVFSVTGAAVAQRYLQYDMARDSSDSHQNLWRAENHFRGEVKLYDRDNHSMGSVGGDDPGKGTVTATVTVNGQAYELSGAGRHEIRDTSGTLLGYADLVPETPEERARLWSEYEHRGGIEERLKNISYGDTDGYRRAIGFFGDEPHKLTWQLNGVARVRFYRADNGHLVYFGDAYPVSPSALLDLRRQMAPDVYTATVNENPPTSPTFTWTLDGKTQSITGFIDTPLSLPDGTKLIAKIVPRDSRGKEAIPEPTTDAPTGAAAGAGLSDYERRGGVQETMKIWHGEQDGVGKAEGFFGIFPRRLKWGFRGVARIRFRRADNSHLVYYATASPAKDPSESVPAKPIFEWTQTGAEPQRHEGFGSFPIILPDGTELTVEVSPYSADSKK